MHCSKSLICVLVAVVATPLLSTRVLCADEWDAAAAKIRMVSPSQYPQLTGEMIEELQTLGCNIPQPWTELSTRNVISGHFAAASQTDVAVLCSRQGVSAIHVFWGGPKRCPAKSDSPGIFAKGSDSNYMEVVEPDNISYSRAIFVADRKAIRPLLTEPVDVNNSYKPHQGIEDAFLGKASTIHYCREGTWLKLLGAD